MLAKKLEQARDTQASMLVLFQSQQPRKESLPRSEQQPT